MELAPTLRGRPQLLHGPGQRGLPAGEPARHERGQGQHADAGHGQRPLRGHRALFGALHRGGVTRARPIPRPGAARHPSERLHGVQRARSTGTGRTWNRSQPQSRCVVVPRPFDADAGDRRGRRSGRWPRARSGCCRRRYCYYGHPEFAEALVLLADSNGCAAGNTLGGGDPAGLHGAGGARCRGPLVVQPRPPPGVDLDSFDLPYLDAIREHYAVAGPQPLGARHHERPRHPDAGLRVRARVAARPRTCWSASARTSIRRWPCCGRSPRSTSSCRRLSHARADGVDDVPVRRRARAPLVDTARIGELPYLAPDPRCAGAAPRDFEDPSTDDLARDVELCVERGRAGRAWTSWCWTRRGPTSASASCAWSSRACATSGGGSGSRRLRDVPVRDGLARSAARAEELNPFTIFF